MARGTLCPPLHTQIGSGLLAILVAAPAWLPSAGAAQPPAGTVVSCGIEVIPLVPPGTRFTGVAAGGYHSLALKQDGTVVAWGNNNSGQATVLGSLSAVKAVADGGQFGLAIKENGTVVQWGEAYGTIPGGLTGVVAVAAGQFHSLALRQDGAVFAWGSDSSGQVTLPSGLGAVKGIAAGYYHSLAIRQDGTVVAWGNND